MYRVIAIIQARLSSNRLPNKVLKEINGKTILEIITKRISASKYINKIIVATSVDSSDDLLFDYVKKHLECEIVRGSLNNVLERFYNASQQFPSEYIVRITADDPFKDAEIIDECVENILSDKSLDYCSNTIEPTYPEGLDIEVFKTSALHKTYKEASLNSEKEHVTPYIWKNKNIFNCKNIQYCENLSKWRWTVDKPEDFIFAEEIYKHFNYNFDVSYKDVIKYIKTNPKLLDINNNTIRNEGYFKSVNEEKWKI